MSGTSLKTRLLVPLALLGLCLLVLVPVALGRGTDVRPSFEEIALAPNSQTNFVGESAPYDVQVQGELGEKNEVSTFDVTFTVLDGPNAGLTQTKTTDDSGNVSFSYTSATAGTDHVRATFVDVSEGDVAGSNIATQIWKPAAVGLAVPDRPVALVKAPDQAGFVAAGETQELPKGVIVDIGGNRAITVKNYFAQKMTFVGVPDRVPSRFRLLSGVRSRLGTIEMKLVGGKFSACNTKPRTLSAHSARTAPTKPKPVRRLWGFGKGKYTTSGRYASATVRGTFWEIADYCGGTLVYVREGEVQVHDFVTGKNVTVKSGTSYFARAS